MADAVGHTVCLFAGGGTGGHLYPGLAIAGALAAREPGARSVFLCSDRPLDAKILSEARAEHRIVPARPAAARPLKFARFIASWGPSVRAARAAIREARAGDPGARVVMAAMGGFVAAPCAQAARAERVPVVLVNLDAVPGKANRWIARLASARLSATGPATGAGDRVPADWERLPPIVRAEAIAHGSKAECRTNLGLDPALPTLFVTGGSQGAGSMNAMLMELARRRSERFQGWQVFHQCGERAEADVRRAYESAGMRARVVAFWSDMASAWGAADLALSRAGAGAVAEAWANATPSIFLPYPYHRDEHQRWNALPLERAGGAVILRDAIDAQANAEAIGPMLDELMRDPARRGAMREALLRLGPARGAEAAADRLIAASRAVRAGR